ncbi:nuclear transcription factor Y subunit beta [Eurytemora carolleeae]|uniref:nuclear transcription factor Y subunit beta n=1 Tax=Eurytemora carolleeae TaxID=1294199 RepID=UPI000C76CCBC|nr:nuclear transcription factor Y subunit beta [Eurytemora carolleeae]XP_023340677.1 nuclear transcription factor Y subunit beta [Eurytemora carolleeae]|eukprot:XP_023340676.1 nuclear transcription factor Y subunit beta-like [Eurytemora affinis]
MGDDKFLESGQYIIQQREEDDDDSPREGELREQDRFLPIYNISKVMKKVVPPAGKVAKEARECVQECVSEFISFITSEASERCQAEKRKTINGEDILFAMSSLGFDNYVEPLKLYLQKYREAMKGERQIEAELSNLGTEVMTASQLQSLTTQDGEVLLYPSQPFQLG